MTLPSTPLALLQVVATSLLDAKYPFAVAGGIAASLYRAEPRTTKDVDIALALGDASKSRDVAVRMLTELGFEPAMGWISMAGEKLSDPVALVIGRRDGDESSCTVDFLLPVFPWVDRAVRRAQQNVIDFGFAHLPTLTPEDLILAKAFALSVEPNRFKDLDDLASIFATENRLDLLYLTEELKRLSLVLPPSLASSAPKALQRSST